MNIDPSDKTFIILAIIAVVAGFLFGGTPDIVDAIRNWIAKQ